MRLLFAFMIALGALPAQNSHYQFDMDPDRLTGIVDFSHLNGALEPKDRIFVRDSHFFRVGPDLTPNTEDDARVRLFGVNLTFRGNFPDEVDAVRIARRLRRLGVNLVRLHHLDTSPSSDPAIVHSILSAGPYPTFRGDAIRRLRTFIDALRAEGVYINLNLHVGYTFRPAVDWVPPLEEFPNASKPLHIFYPRMVELQMDYARQMIQHLGLPGNPALGMVEIDNESSMAGAWQRRRLDRYMHGEYGSTLQRLWNRYLGYRYRSDAELRTAWGESTPDGDDRLTMGWSLEKEAPSDGYFEPMATSASGLTKVVITADGPRLNFKKAGFTTDKSKHHVAAIEVRAELPDGVSRTLLFNVKRDVDPWTVMSQKSIEVTNEWATFRLAFRANFTMNGDGRLSLELGNVPAGATLWVRNASLRLAGTAGLGADESLEYGSVTLVGEDQVSAEPRTNDYLAFLANCDRNYLWALLWTVRSVTGPLTPVAGTQMRWGGLLNLDSHSDTAYDDNHFYVDNLSFPNVAWDPRDWRIRDGSALGSGLGPILQVAAQRSAGRPYTVSEFNQPWPNRQGAEIDPAIAVIASFQDWDALMHFAYSASDQWDLGVPGGFDLKGEWSKIASFGQAAWLFRVGAIDVAKETLRIPITLEDRFRATRERQNGNVERFLNAAKGYEPTVALRHRIELVKDSGEPMPEEASRPPDPTVEADTGQFAYSPDPGLLVIRAPAVAGVIGYLKDAKVTAGDLTVELAAGMRGFAAILVTARDGATIRESRRLLLSNPGSVLRSQEGSNPVRPQQLINYEGDPDWWTIEPEPAHPDRPSGARSTGITPTWMERVEAKVTLRTLATAITVYPLDGSGARLNPLGPEHLLRVEGGFQIHLQAPGQQLSPWYEITAE